jgi:hypothetical protein
MLNYGSCVRFRLPVKNLGLDAAREAAKNNILDINFEPSSTKLDQPKEGKHDPDNQPHEGGNTWAGGVGFGPFDNVSGSDRFICRLEDGIQLDSVGWVAISVCTKVTTSSR